MVLALSRWCLLWFRFVVVLPFGVVFLVVLSSCWCVVYVIDAVGYLRCCLQGVRGVLLWVILLCSDSCCPVTIVLLYYCCVVVRVVVSGCDPQVGAWSSWDAQPRVRYDGRDRRAGGAQGLLWKVQVSLVWTIESCLEREDSFSPVSINRWVVASAVAPLVASGLSSFGSSFGSSFCSRFKSRLYSYMVYTTILCVASYLVVYIVGSTKWVPKCVLL